MRQVIFLFIFFFSIYAGIAKDRLDKKCSSSMDCLAIQGICFKPESVNKKNFTKKYFENEKNSKIIFCNNFVGRQWHGYEVSVCIKNKCRIVDDLEKSKIIFKEKMNKYDVEELRETIVDNIKNKDYDSCLVNTYILSRIIHKDKKTKEQFTICKNLIMKMNAKKND